MTGYRYLVVGAGAAGMAAAHTIRKNDSNGTITVLSNEKCVPYFRPMIPYIVNGKKTPGDIALSGSGIFTREKIDIRFDSSVETMDHKAKIVTTRSGEPFPYDKVLFATGSRPYMPENINGLDTEGVFCLKTMDDATGMAERAQSTQKAVMLGGGILNLKAAFALLEKKINVTLVVYSPEVLSQLMDPEDAFLVRNALAHAGLDIITGCSATDIIPGSDGVSAVLLDNGRELSCQMVCIGKGVMPNTQSLDNTDIDIDSGIVTDKYTACSAADMYAAGDVAVTYDPGTGDKTITALWTNAIGMGICAGLNMAGKQTKYTGTFGIMNATQVADKPFVSMGLVHTKGKDVETHIEKTETTYRKMVFNKEGDRLIGALFIGDITHAGLYRCVIREHKPLKKFKSHLINHTLHYGHFM